MTTDAERREATDQWTIDLREQQLRDLRAQLATANEARQQLQDALHVRDTQLAAATQRAEAAEAKIAIALGADKPNKPATPTERARHWALEAAAQKERAEAAEQALALATNSTPGKGTGVWVPLEKWQKIQDQLLALRVDRSKTVKLRNETDTIIWSLKPDDVPGAINWGDLGCCEVQEVVNDMRRWYRVIIEEADPANPALHAAVLAGLVALGWDADDLEIETAW